jgi:hypothetical protein
MLVLLFLRVPAQQQDLQLGLRRKSVWGRAFEQNVQFALRRIRLSQRHRHIRAVRAVAQRPVERRLGIRGTTVLELQLAHQ